MRRNLIIGLPGAGKSTLAAQLSPPVVSLDDIRHELSDGTPAGEYLARAHFLRACQEAASATFDFTGAGSHRFGVRLALSLVDAPLRVIYVRVAVDVARARIASRNTSVPIPNYGVNPDLALPAMLEVLDKDFNDGFWTSRVGWSAVRVNGEASTTEILKQLEGT